MILKNILPHEVEYILQQNPHRGGAVVLLHPHPLQGGTMHTKLIYNINKLCLSLGFSTLRYNFRGVNTPVEKFGIFGGGIAESDDLVAIINYAQQHWFSNKKIYLVGFSFGSYVAYLSYGKLMDSNLLAGMGLICPPVELHNPQKHQAYHWPSYNNLYHANSIQNNFALFANQDEIVKNNADFLQLIMPNINILQVDGDHFFTNTQGEFFIIIDKCLQKWLL